jgi:hypothetical protein
MNYKLEEFLDFLHKHGIYRAKTYWVTQSRVWFDELRKEYRPLRMCNVCHHITRWPSHYCPNCGRKMTHETNPTGSVKKYELIEDQWGLKRWNKLYREEEEWNARLSKGVPIKEYQQWQRERSRPK